MCVVGTISGQPKSQPQNISLHSEATEYCSFCPGGEHTTRACGYTDQGMVHDGDLVLELFDLVVHELEPPLHLLDNVLRKK